MITGASGGLGAALADALAPTHTLFLAGRPSERLDAVAERLGATTWPLDLADPDAIPAVVEPIVELDVLIHNAGVAYPGRVAETTVDQWRSTMAVNVIGAVALTLELLPALRAAGGHVVFINSGAGVSPRSGNALYSASKAGLKSLADTLRQEEAGKVRVTSIYPGRVDTPMQERLHAFNAARLRTEGIMATPAYRAADHMAPQSVAAAVRLAVNTPMDAVVEDLAIRPAGML